MRNKYHQAGFEKEQLFHETLLLARTLCPEMTAKTLKLIIYQINAQYLRGLFEDKPCVRKLKFLGLHWADSKTKNRENKIFAREGLIVGKTYKSKMFNGARYVIAVKGHDIEIGQPYFDWA